ncbi:helix-turn-helix domain-containing protein [Hylemonella sp. W303a]|uniref:helix-turn-helix domain-containing protein n=1 Tax=Hylemonella sp. W303a TaxID=3389873 RepID=UPI00396B0937
MEELYQCFGRNVRQRRRILGFSQERLGELTQMGRPTVAAIEAGRQAVALHQAVALSSALGVSLGELVGDVAAPALNSLAHILESDDLKKIARILEHRSISE